MIEGIRPTHNASAKSVRESIRHLNHFLACCPQLQLSCGEHEIYFRRARIREQALVSCLDERSPESFFTESYVFTLTHQNQPVGAASVAVGVNVQRTVERNCHGRVDLVMVEPEFQGYGYGRILALSAVGFLLKQHRDTLYSLSCLAAHPAVEKILVNHAGFQRDCLTGLNYTHLSLDVNDENIGGEIDHVCAQIDRDAGITAYRHQQDSRLNPHSGQPGDHLQCHQTSRG